MIGALPIMTDLDNLPELTPRQEEILSLIVHTYTQTPEPVSSRFLVDTYELGVSSATVAYSFNRADWSYTPGGTFWNAVNLVRPDFPEDKVWPFLWQEREYIITAPCYYMFSVLAVDDLLNK